MVQYHPYSGDVPQDLQNHLNTIVDSINTLASLPSGGDSGAEGEGTIAEVQDAQTGRVTIDGTLVRYLYRYFHLRITSDAGGTTLVDPTTFTGSEIFIGINNNESPTQAGDAFQYSAFSWASGRKIAYRTAPGQLVLSAVVTVPAAEGEITTSTTTIDSTAVTAAGAQGLPGADSIFVEMRTDEGDIFKNDQGMTTATIFVHIGGVEQSTTVHNVLNYRWIYNDSTVYVDSNRNLLSLNGVPAIQGGTVPAGGMLADSTINFGSLVRSINIGNEDITNKAQIDCIVSNIPD